MEEDEKRTKKMKEISENYNLFFVVV